MDYANKAIQARKKVLELVHKAGTSHIASNFSVIDIATVLYENLKNGDEVVWSAGWKAAALYYFLHKQGKITEEQLNSFPNPPLLGLAETTVPGVWVNGGSVGHGLGVAVGMALGKKRAGEKGTIYCIMSDGELNEGSTWEAAAFAYKHCNENLRIIIDSNGWQAMGKTEEVLGIDAIRAFEGFKWSVVEIDGHNYNQIEAALNWKHPERIAPIAIVAHTVKGKGVSFMENHLLFHYKHVEKSDYEKAMAELEGVAATL